MVYLLAILLLFALVYWLFMSSYSQIFGYFPYKGKTTKKVVALTFDDGPNEPYTSMVVDYLNSKNIKATFFEVGTMVQRYPDVTKKLVASGHVVANHSLSHQFYKYFVSPKFTQEVTANQQIIAKVIGKKPALFRSPWLYRQPLLLATLRNNNLQPVSGVFCHAFEVFRPSPERIARRAIAKARPGAIIIFHDGIEGKGGNRQQTVDAIKITVDELIKQGYGFVTIDQLLGVPAYQ
jgi:peptidoglycan/xylan/chitin deacetylase (PgdA/CDA1 family)